MIAVNQAVLILKAAGVRGVERDGNHILAAGFYCELRDGMVRQSFIDYVLNH